MEKPVNASNFDVGIFASANIGNFAIEKLVFLPVTILVILPLKNWYFCQ